MPEHPSMWNALAGIEFSVSHLDVDGTRTRVLQAGAGQPLVLLHGIGGHLEAYMYNIASFSRHFRVIAYDMPGHGYSTTATKDLEISDYVRHLAALLDMLGHPVVNLNGESLGGWVSIKFAVRYPERMRRLVLNTPGGTMARPEVMNRLRTLSQAAADSPTPEAIRARLEWLMAHPETVTDELVQARQGVYSRASFSESIRHIMCLQELEVRRRNMVTDEELHDLEAPTMVVWTSDDPSGPAAAGMHIAETVPDGRFQLIEDAGHWPQWEQTERFNEVVLRFLTEAD